LDLEHDPVELQWRASGFTPERAAQQYLSLLFPEG